VEIINEGDICCIGYGEICAMDTFAKLLDRTYCLELDNDWFFNAIKFLTTDNVAVFINDCFDDDGYNVEGICLRLDDKWSRQFEVVALRIILPGEEFFMRYGREFWCYRLHFESLTVAQQHKCSYFYEINMKEDLVEVIEIIEAPVTAVQSPSKGKRKGKQPKK